MSRASFVKNFQNPLLKKLDQEARKSVQKQKGQLLILADTTDLENVIRVAVPDTLIKNNDLKAALNTAKVHAAKLHASFKSRNPRRYNAIVAKLPSINLPYTLGIDMFIVSSFSKSIDTIKKTMLKVLLERGVFNETQQLEISRNLHKGHGARGTAVSQVQIARSVSALDNATKTLLLHNLGSAQGKGDLSDIEHREIEKLVTNSRQIVTKAGKLTANYVSVISFQEGKDNIKDSEAEKALKKAYRTFIAEISPELVNMQNSSSLHQKVERSIIDQFRGKKNIKVKSKSSKAKRSTKNKSVTKPNTKKSKVQVTRGVPLIGKKTAKSAAMQPLYLIGLINKKLPQTVMKNMGVPRLENRSGRFARSARVTDIIQTPQGYPSIGYTYDRKPYGVFEDGDGAAPWANGQRDPRTLIDKSIREIAAQFAMGRFYTRRQ